MHFPLALALLGLLTSFVNAAPPSIGRRNNGGHPTSISPTKTAQATTRTVTVDCPTATASSAPSSRTSYVFVVSNGTLPGLVPAGSVGDGSVVVSLVSLERQASTYSDNANLTSSSGAYVIPTKSELLWFRNDYGNVTVDKISVVNSTSVVPSSTSPAAPTATAGILDDLGSLFDDIVDAAVDVLYLAADIIAIPLTPLEAIPEIPFVVVDIIEDVVDVVLDVGQIINDVDDLLNEGIRDILGIPDDPLPVITAPIVARPSLSSSAAGPGPTHSSGTGKELDALSIRPLRGDSAVVVVCGNGGKRKGEKEHH